MSRDRSFERPRWEISVGFAFVFLPPGRQEEARNGPAFPLSIGTFLISSFFSSCQEPPGHGQSCGTHRTAPFHMRFHWRKPSDFYGRLHSCKSDAWQERPTERPQAYSQGNEIKITLPAPIRCRGTVFSVHLTDPVSKPQWIPGKRF